MAMACPKCGETTTDRIGHGFLYGLATVLGYSLRRCGNCRRYRLVRRLGSGPHRYGPSDDEYARVAVTPAAAMAPPDLPSNGNSPATGAVAAGSSCASPTQESERRPHQYTHPCPRCGSREYRRSHRTWLERRRGIRAMYRCRKCSERFSLPQAEEAERVES